MKKKIVLIWVGIIVLFGIFVFIFRSRDMNLLLDLNPSNIEKIELMNLDESCIITENDEMEAVIEPLQEMNVRRKILNNTEGVVIRIILTYENGKVVHLSLLSEQININHHLYTVDKDNVNTYQKLFHKFKVK